MSKAVNRHLFITRTPELFLGHSDNSLTFRKNSGVRDYALYLMREPILPNCHNKQNLRLRSTTTP
jgi:hypothetical protein